MTDSQNHPADQSAQPQYGQRRQPEYGAMSDQYPAGYDPYVYGRPDPQPPQDGEASSQQPNAPVQQFSAPSQNGPSQGWPVPGPGVPVGGGPATYGNAGQPASPQHTPRYVHGIDVNDPNRNPLYGRWDPLAIVSLVCALFFPLPLLPAIMGAVSMRRTRLFHMKGFWLAFAAVFINVFFTIMEIWLAINGLSMVDYYQQMLDMMGGYSGTSDGSISA